LPDGVAGIKPGPELKAAGVRKDRRQIAYCSLIPPLMIRDEERNGIYNFYIISSGDSGLRMTDMRLRAEKLNDDWVSALPIRDACIALIESAFLEIERETLERVQIYLKKYREAYTEDIFPVVDMEQFDPDVRTAVAGRMGRFVLDNCINDVPTLGEKG
jgi:hypothetical protein